MPDLSINLWPGWYIDHEIGSGSYGKVYEIHRKNGKYIEKSALKVIRIPQDHRELEQFRKDGGKYESTEAYFEKQVEKIRNEIGIMQRLVGHSNIVSYEDYRIDKRENEIAWDILIRMELLTPLPAFLLSHSMKEENVIQIGMDISRALILCHDSGIIHRDIKPQNILINNWGCFKLGDFGISRIMSGDEGILSFKGTIPFMAPETFKLQGTDARSDIYSLALVLYRILNEGRAPFLSDSVFLAEEREAAQRRRLKGEDIPPPEGVSQSLWKVLSTALQAEPAFRYQTASQFYEALLQVERLKQDAEGYGDADRSCLFGNENHDSEKTVDIRKDMECQSDCSRQSDVDRLLNAEETAMGTGCCPIMPEDSPPKKKNTLCTTGTLLNSPSAESRILSSVIPESLKKKKHSLSGLIKIVAGAVVVLFIVITIIIAARIEEPATNNWQMNTVSLGGSFSQENTEEHEQNPTEMDDVIAEEEGLPTMSESTSEEEELLSQLRLDEYETVMELSEKECFGKYIVIHNDNEKAVDVKGTFFYYDENDILVEKNAFTEYGIASGGIGIVIGQSDVRDVQSISCQLSVNESEYLPVEDCVSIQVEDMGTQGIETAVYNHSDLDIEDFRVRVLWFQGDELETVAYRWLAPGDHHFYAGEEYRLTFQRKFGKEDYLIILQGKAQGE